MRCPKCGYNSFDHLDSCKKCGKDLVEHKQKYGIVSVLFPGEMKPGDSAAEVGSETIADEAVAVATAAAATAVAGEAMAEDSGAAAAEPAATEAGEGDDFGFDFMGDSEEEEDLSFDELFEEAPADEDVEETLPSPEQEAAEGEGDEFAFEPGAEEESAEGELESDFGFDPSAEKEDLEADDFELPPAEKDEFSFDSDDEDFSEEAEGAEEDPKDPFDLPESSQDEEAPEDRADLFSPEIVPDSSGVEESDLSLTGSIFAAEVSQEEESPIAEAPAVADSEEELADSFFLEDVTDATAEQDPSGESIAAEDSQETAADETIFAASGIGAATAGTAVMVAGSLPAGEESGEKLDDAEPESAPKGAGLLPQTGSRVAAFCLDLLLLVIVGACFVIAAEAAMSPADDSLMPSLETLIDLSVPYFLVLFSLAFGYFTLFHFLAGQTPGKMLAGLRVETLEGEPLIFSQAFLRSVGGLLQVLPAGLGYFVILSSPDRRGWNDRLAGTRLISLKGLSEEV